MSSCSPLSRYRPDNCCRPNRSKLTCSRPRICITCSYTLCGTHGMDCLQKTNSEQRSKALGFPCARGVCCRQDCCTEAGLTRGASSRERSLGFQCCRGRALPAPAHAWVFHSGSVTQVHMGAFIQELAVITCLYHPSEEGADTALGVTVEQTQVSSLSCIYGVGWSKFIGSFAASYRKDPGGFLKALCQSCSVRSIFFGALAERRLDFPCLFYFYM